MWAYIPNHSFAILATLALLSEEHHWLFSLWIGITLNSETSNSGGREMEASWQSLMPTQEQLL